MRFRDLAPRPPSPPRSPGNKCLSFSVFLCDAGREGGWGGRGAKSYDREKAWLYKKHSILYELHIPTSPPPYFPSDSRVCVQMFNDDVSFNSSTRLFPPCLFLLLALQVFLWHYWRFCTTKSSHGWINVVIMLLFSAARNKT